MIKIFGSTDKNFISNGDIVVNPLKAKVHKEDNGDFYLDLETDISYIDYLVAGNIVVASTPQGDQAFRISNPQKTRRKITVKAWHVFYDAQNYLIQWSNVVDKNGNQALTQLNNATEPESEFDVFSDVETISSYECDKDSLATAINVVLDQWGGHLVRDNFSVKILSSIGQDNGVTVQYRKNLKELTCEEDWENVVTKLLPVGKDGIMLNSLNPSADVYVTSDLQYDIPYTKTASFSQDIDKEDYPTEIAYKRALIADLRSQAEAYVAENCIPQVNYKLKANIEKITDIGDIIEVKDERLGIDLMTSVISFDYDCILNKYTEIEFGNFQKSLSGLVSNITASVNKDVADQVQNAVSPLKQETDDIVAVLNNSYVIYDGDKMLVVDTLPKESATNVIRIDDDGIWMSKTGIDGTFDLILDIDGTFDINKLAVSLAQGVCTVASGWESYTSGDTPALVRQGNAVHFTWICKPTSTVVLGTIPILVCTIPEGFRPSETVQRLCQCSGTSFFFCEITPLGEVFISRLRDVGNASGQYTDGTTAMDFHIDATWI